MRRIWTWLLRNAGRACLCTALGTSGALADGAFSNVNGGVTLGTDHLFRGVSQTLGGATLQATVDTELESGFYAYLWAGNVDFVPDGEPDDGARVEVDAAVGFASDISDQWSVDVTLVRYMFPGTVDEVSYDYNELLATLWYEESYRATLAYSNNVFGSDESGIFASLGAHYELPAELMMVVEYGYYDLEDAYGASYSYVDVGFGRPIGEVEVTLAYHDTFGDAQQIFYAQSIGSRLVLTIDLEF